jgi:hypothetical protein
VRVRASGRGFGELAQSGEVGPRDRCRCLYFYSNHVTTRVFNHDIDFVVVSIAKVKKIQALIAPCRELQEFGKYNGG